MSDQGGSRSEALLSLIHPVRTYLFALVSLLILALLLGMLASTGVQDLLLTLLLISFALLVFQILGTHASTQPSSAGNTAGEEAVVAAEVVETVDNTPFAWVNAMRCDEIARQDQRSQCENDGFTLHQQLGGFADWVDKNKADRRVYTKDYGRLRRDRCNLFPREDLQTACKREALGDF
jgi:hypothetical protein